MRGKHATFNRERPLLHRNRTEKKNTSKRYSCSFSRVAIYAEIKKGTVTPIGQKLKPYQVYLSDAGQHVHDARQADI